MMPSVRTIHRRQHKLGSAALAFIDLLRNNGSRPERNGRPA
jgi:hypothetical protein